MARKKKVADEVLIATPEQSRIFAANNVLPENQQSLLKQLNELVNGDRATLELRATESGITVTPETTNNEIGNAILERHFVNCKRMFKALTRALSISAQMKEICKADSMHNAGLKAELLAQEQCGECGNFFPPDAIGSNHICQNCSKTLATAN